MNNKKSSNSHDIGPTIKTEFLQITVVATHRALAVDLITFLTKQKIVACAQIQGPESYKSIENSAGWRCRFKTSKKLYDRVCTEINAFFNDQTYKMQHSNIVKGSDQFLSWLNTQLIQ